MGGLGKLKPNIVLVGYKNIWDKGVEEDKDIGSAKSLASANEYFEFIQ